MTPPSPEKSRHQDGTNPTTSRDNPDNSSIKNNNTKELTEREHKLIQSMGKIAFTRLHLGFYKRMCRSCKAKSVQIILQEKARMDYDKLCDMCQRIYDGMARKYIT